MTETILSEKELFEHLERLRYTVKHIRYQDLRNIIFFDIRSFYLYVSTFHCPDKKEMTIHEIFEKIENYIPLDFSDEALHIFLQIAKTKNQGEAEEILSLFSSRLRFDFIHLLRSIKTKEEWIDILSACEGLRRKKEVYFKRCFQNMQ